MKFKSFFIFALAVYTPVAINNVAAQGLQSNAGNSSNSTVTEYKSINDWLLRMQEASKKRTYVGTYVVSSGGTMSSAKIWHICEGNQKLERVETLTGPPRSIFRHNDRVVTFLPDHKVVRSERRESVALFPGLLQSTDNDLANFYKVKSEGVERVAGFDSDVVMLVPKDGMRFG